MYTNIYIYIRPHLYIHTNIYTHIFFNAYVRPCVRCMYDAEILASTECVTRLGISCMQYAEILASSKCGETSTASV